jgi:hypothetical protein
MITIYATQDLKAQAKQTLQNIYQKCSEENNVPVLFISSEINLSTFFNITHSKESDLIIDYTDVLENGTHLNASISLPLQSSIYIDLIDKSFNSKNEQEVLRIDYIRRIIIPHKYKHKVKDIYITDFHKIHCDDLSFLRRDILSEMIMAKLFYMSSKFDLNFHIGIQLTANISKPKYIKDITFGCTFDMVDVIAYNI